ARTLILRLASVAMVSFLVPALSVVASTTHLGLTITVTEGEHSRDSNSTTTSISLSGNQIHYVKTFKGYHAGRRDAVDKRAGLRQVDLDRIRELLKENSLLKSRSSVSPIDQPGRYVQIDAAIVVGKRRSTLKFLAMRQNAESNSLYTGL